MTRFFPQDERDALLYHVLAQEPGLVIVFVNAIVIMLNFDQGIDVPLAMDFRTVQ